MQLSHVVHYLQKAFLAPIILSPVALLRFVANHTACVIFVILVKSVWTTKPKAYVASLAKRTMFVAPFPVKFFGVS